MPHTVWFTLDDEDDTRKEFVCSYISQFPTTDFTATQVAESVMETQDLAPGDDGFTVYLFPDDDPETKPGYVLDVDVTWEANYSTSVVKEEEDA